MNISSFFWSLALLLIPLLLPFLIALAAVLYTRLLQRLPMQQRLIVSSMAHTVVAAVEQMMPDEALGSQKKGQALHALVSILSAAGIHPPTPLLEMAIEAAVFELHTLHPHTSDNTVLLDANERFPWRPTQRNLSVVQPPNQSV